MLTQYRIHIQTVTIEGTHNMKLKLTLLTLCAAGFAGIYWYQNHSESSHIVQKKDDISIIEYQEAKHKDFIKRQFKENWYWLISSPDYDVDHMLDTKTPHTYEPQFTGKLKTVVLEDETGNPAGFASYYMRAPAVGDILFIEVDQHFRGKRYAGQLVQHALDELKKMGAQVVKMATRTDNLKAQKVYERLGFPVINQSNGFVHYRKEL